VKNSEAMNVVDWCGATNMRCCEKVSIEEQNRVPTLFEEFSGDSQLRLNLLHRYIPNGLFLGGSGEWWAIATTALSLGQEKKVFTLFRKATDVIVTFGQLKKMAVLMTKLQDMNLTECSPQAAHWAAGTFRRLRPQKLAGSQSATATLGRKCVVADWLLDKIYVLEFDFIGDHEVFSPISLSEDFLVAYINYISWAKQSALREPVMAAARRAMQFVADRLSLNRCWYNIDVTTL